MLILKALESTPLSYHPSGYKAALSVVCRRETEAGLVPQRLSQGLTWHCHPKKQLLPKPQLSPSPGCHFCLLSGLACVLVQPQDGLEQGLIEALRAIPSHAGVTLWWNTTTDRFVPKLMLHEACRAVVTNSGCFEIPLTLGSGNTGVVSSVSYFLIYHKWQDTLRAAVPHTPWGSSLHTLVFPSWGHQWKMGEISCSAVI